MPIEPPKLKDIFLAALDISGAVERQAYVNSACGTDSELRNCVLDMLVAHQKALTPIPEGPTQAETAPPAPVVATLPSGTIIDQRYKIIELIAEGGMGSVYRACRVADMRMEVAIKLVKPDMASGQILSRFNIERQALAIMKHENIAKVLDAGSTREGAPYFVMELVKGLPITKFCDDNKLTVNERLELFEKVCSAVQHAHQKGIVHRDLKPSNILVGLYDDIAVPKVIDFGLAKALYQPITDDILHTKFGTFVGTWQYTAPEQAILNNLDIDTRADIYSLGVILYELLTGNPPIERSRITHAVMEEVLRIIREEEPPKPSTKIHSSAELPSLAALRRSEPLQLERQVRGELDWIVMKALEKDRNRRFATANELGLDVRRYLAGEAVLSGPVAWQYKLRKFVHKHRGAVLAASLLFLAISVGAVVSTVGWVTAYREKIRADQNAEAAQAVNAFLCEDVLEQADPSAQIKPDQKFISNITVVKAVDRAAEKVRSRFADKPQLEAVIRKTIGKTYMGLGEMQKARLQLEKAEELLRTMNGELDPARLSVMHELGGVALLLSNFEKSKDLLESTLDLRRKVLGKNNRDTLRTQYLLAMSYSYCKKLKMSRQLFEATLEMQKHYLTIDHIDTLLTQRELASVLIDEGEQEKAIELLQEVLSRLPLLLDTDHPEMLIAKSNYAYCLQSMNRSKDAENVMTEVIGKSKVIHGEKHPSTLSYRLNMEAILIDRMQANNDSIQVKQKYRTLSDLVHLMKQVNGPLAYDTLAATGCYGTALVVGGDHMQAEAVLLDAYSGCLASLGENNDKTILMLESLIALYEKMNNGEKLKEYKGLLDKSKQL